TPEDITVMDPACGSGHILVYAFDLLEKIYLEQGYLANEIPTLILKHNLFGLEIDDRAAQLASFALMMQARKSDPNIFRKGILPNIISIQESAGIKESFLYTRLDKESKRITDDLINAYKDAKNLGSILNPEISNLDVFTQRLAVLKEQDRGLAEHDKDNLLRLQTLIDQTRLLNKKYDVVVTNPPYMGSRNMNASLTEYLRDTYPTSRRDLFAVFMARMHDLTKSYGYHVTVTMQSWMFLSSFEKFRLEILENYSIVGLTHMANMVMGIAFGTSATILRKNVLGIKGTYQYVDLDDLQDNTPIEFPVINKRYSTVAATNFRAIPGSPIAYWASEKFIESYERGFSVEKISDFTGSRHKTANNQKYVRCFWELKADILQNNQWLFYAKGGSYRKYYGNIIDVVDWRPSALGFYKRNKTSNLLDKKYWHQEGITYTDITSRGYSFRYFRGGAFDMSGPTLVKVENQNYILGLLNSVVFQHHADIVNPTFHLQVRDVKAFPVILDKSRLEDVDRLVESNVLISRTDWDSFETSWDFKRHPLLVHKDGGLVEAAFKRWEDFTERQFMQLKANEEELNRIFIEIYGLEDELTPDVAEEDVTIRRAERERDIKSFISYAVGCMFGRYSLDEEGLVYAGGEFEPDRYRSFKAAENGILPILDKEYFEDDIVSRFVDFVRVTFGEEFLEENLEYIADSIGRRKADSAREGIRRYFLRDFYKDHVRIYKKRPIYWLFRSASGVFNALVYLHRYDRDTVGRIRTDYLLELQDRLAAEESGLRRLLGTELARQEETRTRRRLEEIDKQMKELQEYHGEIHSLANERIDLDLDDGVAVNYKKFGKALARL
ncbi:MAG: BREX-1 system adenine-specific DNA-methyltransferase PglX, partial [Firmicutes bacterium]|nr:BREX-1 system adenine-specific DNA-methyltransferase PglX [Bacillota bacterium]